MTTTTKPDIDAELTPVLTAAQERLAKTSAVLHGLTERQRAIRQSATDADAKIAELEGRRKQLLVAAHHDADPAARAELEAIPAAVALHRQHAFDAREASDMFQVQIAELAPAHQANARAVLDAQFSIDRRRHQREGEQLRKAFDALEEPVVKWLASAKLFDERRHAIEGVHIREDNDGRWRLMSAWTVWSKQLFGRVVGINRLAALRGEYGDDAGRLDV
jgi:hypothetical protein